MEKTSRLRSGIYVLNNQDPSGTKKWVTHITKRMATVLLEEEKQWKRKRTTPAQPYPTWAQTKNLTRKAEAVLKETGTPLTPDKLFLGMLAVLSCTSVVKANYTYWISIPDLPLLQFVDWNEPSPLVFTNDSQHFPPPWSRAGPTHPDQEGKAINISIGYKVLPICFGASPPCYLYFLNGGVIPIIMAQVLGWGFFAAASFLLNQSKKYYHGRISNSTNALFLPEEPPCEAISRRRKHQGPPLLWSDCQGIIGKISRYLNVTFIDWGPHEMFVNCSEWEEGTCNGTKILIILWGDYGINRMISSIGIMVACLHPGHI
ncbi:endogenous retrovirus group K member 25 Env polyprotein-like [Cervus elaphus]|uniref:endogenous retrovirus group K member 25 Env polyprotein-like n=1 Tax=Cervus elaphus TaxID=9860 RepID=UPI001CC28899|nr:endogenous retrovirus group K member 25 Env polyprotein-like [Cervus elaphus]XP_043766968.1 endogenous retrovirus group K member 25 Env polyprotein-like [Cervus elaphus]